MADFPCTECGVCCKLASLIPEIPFGSREDGACEHLTEDNKCAIYKDRPEVCSIHKTWKRKFAKTMSEKEYHELSAESCNTLIDNSDIENKNDYYVYL